MLYHEWLLKQYRESDMAQLEMTLPPTDTDLPLGRPSVWSSCAWCDMRVPYDKVIIKQYYTGHSADVEHWCSIDCHHQWYISRLHSWGL